MDSNSKKKIIFCSVLGILTFTAALFDIERIPTENEASLVIEEKENSSWSIKNGRYNGTPYDDILYTQTAVPETSYEIITEFSETDISSEETTEISETSTDEESSLTTDLTDVSESVSELSDITSIPETEVPAETIAAPPSNPSVSNPIPAGTPKDSSYFDSCVFVGDSIMEGLSAYKFLPESQVFASVGLNPYQLNTNAIDTYYGNVTPLSAVVSAKPSNIYLMMGMNGVAWNMNDAMTEQIGIFIDNIKAKLPYAKIYLMSVTPVSAEREAKPSASDGQILNSQINSFNSSLLSLANDKSVYYLDLNSYLKGSNGCLPSDVTSDGIHISKAVYEDILSYILSHTV